jgi:signal transduction histidine kinase
MTQAVVDALAHPGPFRQTYRLRRPDGKEIHVHGEGQALVGPDGKATRMFGFVQDVTVQHALEQEAQRQREARIAQEAEMDRLRRADEFRAQFLNGASHELRTPLTPVLTSLRVLSADAQLTPGQRRHVDILQRGTDRLRRVIDDVMGAADLQAKSMTMERRPEPIAPLLREAVARGTRPADAAGIALVLGGLEDDVVLVDGSRIALVLDHLVGNAIKFTPKGGRVTVSCRRSADECRVEVQDTGVGMAPETIGRLWRPFAQAHDKEQKTDSGSGLGLYVTKGVIELLGGEVGCSSPGPGKGSTFWFTLPLAPVDVPAPSPQASSGSP